MSTQKMNFMLVGVGGQGTLLASDILADLGVRLGFLTPRKPRSTAWPSAAAA